MIFKFFFSLCNKPLSVCLLPHFPLLLPLPLPFPLYLLPLFAQNTPHPNHKTTTLPSLNHQPRWFHPNTKTPKLKLAKTHYRTRNKERTQNQNPKSKFNINPDENQTEKNP